MTDFNQNDNNQNDGVCMICHRKESELGKLIRMPGGLCICQECFQKSMDEAVRYTGGDFSNLPGMPPFMQPGNSQNATANKASGEENSPNPENPAGEEKNTNPENPAETGSKAPDTGSVPAQTGVQPPENQPENGKPEAEKPQDNPQRRVRHPQMGFSMFVSPEDVQQLLGRMTNPRAKAQEKPVELPKIDMKNVPAPHVIYDRLSDYVVGQDQAKKAISVAIYNHYKRLANEDKSVEIEKSNMLMIGPTGSGKTFLVQTLAKLLDVPLAIADATALTEAGYIGDDIESVVTKLLAAAGDDVQKAERGIIYIDEIDKLARKKNASQRDISGEAVQQGLLKLLEGAEVEVPVGSNSKNAMVPMQMVNTKNILFICGGAFPDLEDIIKERLNAKSSMGFGAELKDKYDGEKDILKYVTTEDVRKFGMIPEFIGRMPVIYTLQPMSRDMLIRVLKEPKNAIIKQYQKLLEMDEVELIFAEDAYEAIAEKAFIRDTGARALRSIIEEFMLDIMFEIPKDPNIGRVTITREYIEGKGGPIIEMRGALS